MKRKEVMMFVDIRTGNKYYLDNPNIRCYTDKDEGYVWEISGNLNQPTGEVTKLTPVLQETD